MRIILSGKLGVMTTIVGIDKENIMKLWEELIEAVGDLLDSADDTGCDGLSVVNQKLLDRVAYLYGECKDNGRNNSN